MLIPLVLVLALLAAGGLAGWLYFAQYRPDKQTDDAVAQSAVDAARDGTVALLSYKPDTLNQDFAAAKSHLTGDFLNYYDQFTKQVVTPAAKREGGDDHRSGRGRGGFRTAPEFGGRAGLRQPGHHQQGTAGSGDGVEQRAGVVDQGARRPG